MGNPGPTAMDVVCREPSDVPEVEVLRAALVEMTRERNGLAAELATVRAARDVLARDLQVAQRELRKARGEQ
ncbi:hypothetical protein Ade02nite_19230 [Paractinoplanes deccanensis]|uniref:Uncharacterized protein n=1 Tax=Paractinoplanes deccanensis TaxID=113561 RepID=A0ABQ3Y013_9ACTN|nr:hypothetical protein [Actinoplanes deccanensis]GID73282.1 hypothetical protein Ade02nite_19230 [Actinoplanes deccanensis]